MSQTTDSAPAQPSGPGEHPPARRRLLLAALAAGVVLALVALVLVLGDRNGSAADERAASSSAGASTTPAAGPTESAAPSAAEPAPGGDPASQGPSDPDAAPPTLDPVPLDAVVDVDGVQGSLVLVEEIQGSGQGVGNINGPALRVTVRLVNSGTADLALSGVAVSVFHGADRTPASPLEDRSQSPFAGSLPPGDTAEGVYVFAVPADDRDSVRVEVGVQPGADVIVYTGKV